MFDIEKIKNTWFFKENILKRWDILFDEWEINNNIYYIVYWKLIVEKYTTKERKISKQLAILNCWDFLWEWSLNNSDAKQVKISSLEDTKVLYIDWQKDFLDFTKSFPELAKDILVNIISLTNKRVLDWNKYITSIYEINKSITEIKNINYKEIFNILEKINLILDWDFLLFLDINIIDKKYLTLKYDSRKSWKMQDILIEKWKYKLSEIWITESDKIISKEITIWTEVLWTIIISKKHNFNENEKRIFIAMINSLSWILKQKKILEEERDKNFSNI